MEQLQKNYRLPTNGTFELRTSHGDILEIDCSDGAVTFTPQAPTANGWQINKVADRAQGVGGAAR